MGVKFPQLFQLRMDTMKTNLDNLIRLNELAETIHDKGYRVAVLLEGRDGAGKSGTIRELTRYLPPYAHRIVPSFMPTKRMMKSWLAEWHKTAS
jgi:polyphosphate kinase 2 (PPK2 family)